MNGVIILSRTIAMALVFFCFSIALAEEEEEDVEPEPLPEFPRVDQNGIDLGTGAFTWVETDVAIGTPGAGGLSYSRAYSSSSWQHASSGWRSPSFGTVIDLPNSSEFFVSIGDRSESFTMSLIPRDGGGFDRIFESTRGLGSTLSFSLNDKEYTYVARDGTIAIFDSAINDLVDPTEITAGVLVKLIKPNGEITEYHYNQVSFRPEIAPGVLGQPVSRARLQSITNSFGYQIHFTYANDTPTTLNELKQDWRRTTKATAFNRTIDYCAPNANVCSFSRAWPQATYTATKISRFDKVTDSLGREQQYSYTSDRLTGIRWPGSTSDNIIISYDSNERVSSVNRGFGTWTYSYSDAGDARTTTITAPGGAQRTVVSSISTELMTSATDPLNRTTSYQYDLNRRVTRITGPEGNYVSYTYDTRSNRTEVRTVAKPGSSLADIVTSATYPTTCTNQKTCNKPTTTTDALGGVTNYYYDEVNHGGLTRVTAPAPSGGAARPETRITYAQKQARYLAAPGNTDPGPAIWVSTKTEACASGSSCTSAANETVTEIVWPATATVNNLQPTAVTTRSGNSAVSSTTTTTYNDLGDVETVNGPLSGNADTTKYYYDALRRVVAVVGPDPDDGGALKYRAAKTTYNTLGLPTTTEIGTATGQGGTSIPGFVRLQRTETVYDAYARPIKGIVYDGAGSTILGVSQTSYTNRGEVECTALRMNPASFSSPPGACLLGTSGSYGADRIAKVTYDLAGQVLKTTSAYGTSIAQDSSTATYTSSGLVQTLTDANGNRTTYEYDGFNRPLKTRFPSKTTTGVSSTADYVQNTYDTYGRLTSVRLRDGNSFSYTYDNLGRVTFENAPGTDADHTYTYDNFGRMLTATDGAMTLTYAYDALNRITGETHSVLGAVGYAYDAASRMTRLSYPGSFFVDYEYDNAGAMTGVEENGVTSLATYAYDDLGRRTSLTMGNGAVTSYGYDGGSRLTSLTHNLTGTVHDQTWGFSYNPAGQITQETSTNALYDWPAPGGNATDAYAENGLNQYTSVAGSAVSHDDLGNTTSAEGSIYGFDKRKRLTSASPGGTLEYDAAGRLYEESSGGTTTRFNYAGSAAIEEKNTAGTVQRRYVPGAGVDETLVWYEGSGTGDKRYLLSDVRGSIAAVTNASGAATAVNRYDEYGLPHANNNGRFGFTGQMNLTGFGLQHYKARAYHPGMGRFIQPDPIGYGDGMNMYAYVGNDPINMRDPSGLQSDDKDNDYDWCTNVGMDGQHCGNFIDDGDWEDDPYWIFDREYLYGDQEREEKKDVADPKCLKFNFELSLGAQVGAGGTLGPIEASLLGDVASVRANFGTDSFGRRESDVPSSPLNTDYYDIVATQGGSAGVSIGGLNVFHPSFQRIGSVGQRENPSIMLAQQPFTFDPLFENPEMGIGIQLALIFGVKAELAQELPVSGECK